MALLFLAVTGVSSAAEPLSLNSLIEEAKKNNPEILAARKRWQASLARIPQAKSLENPSVGLTFEKIPRGTLKLDAVMPEDRMLSVSQMFPFFGKLTLKGKIALVESQMSASELKGTELEVISEVKSAYYDLFMNDKEKVLRQESLSLLKGIAKIAEAKYAAAETTQDELFKLNLEIARLSNTITNLDQERLAKVTRLNAMLDRDPESTLDVPELNEDASFATDMKPLYQATLLNQPELIVLSYAIEKNRYAKSLAQKSFFPDMMAGLVQRGISSGNIGPWDLMLSFSVPFWFWTKQRYEVKEAITNLEEAEAVYQAMRNKAFAMTKDLAAQIEIAKNKINLYRTTLKPMLESTISSSLAAFQAGKGDVMVLLDNQRMLVETKMDYYRALVEYNMNLADLERSVGTELKGMRQ